MQKTKKRPEATGEGVLRAKSIPKKGVFGRFIDFFEEKGRFWRRDFGKLCRFYGDFPQMTQIPYGYEVGRMGNSR
jgi:hypothetical protein